LFVGVTQADATRMDESAVIDGCNSWQVLFPILMPLSKPALFSAAIFDFIWQWSKSRIKYGNPRIASGVVAFLISMISS
jgi:ABC-type glycerol-3-phosphate transport system permease component